MKLNPNDRILILKGFRIGDAICQTPAIHLLHKIKPQAKIGMVTLSEATTEVFLNNPHIHEIITHPNKKQFRQLNQEYDYALAFDQKYIVEPHLRHLTIPTHFLFEKDFDKKHLCQIVPNELVSLYHLQNPTIPYDYQLFPQHPHDKQVKKLLYHKGAKLTSEEILIGMHMGCFKVAKRAARLFQTKISSSKSWPFDRFKLLADRLYQLDNRIRIVLTGTKEERRLVQRIFKHDAYAIFVTGEVSLLALAQMMKYFKLFITGDTGPMHVATAMNIPMVAMFASTKPSLTGPFPIQSHHEIITANHMADIAVDEVFNAAQKLMNS